MAFMASERDEERKTLEEKLQQLEELPEQTGGKYVLKSVSSVVEI